MSTKKTTEVTLDNVKLNHWQKEYILKEVLKEDISTTKKTDKEILEAFMDDRGYSKETEVKKALIYLNSICGTPMKDQCDLLGVDYENIDEEYDKLEQEVQ